MTWIIVLQRSVSEGIHAKYLCKLLNAFGSEGIVVLGGRLCNFRTNIQDVSFDGYGEQFRIEVLYHPIQPDIIAIILRDDVVPHFLDLEYVCIVKIHKMTTNEGEANQSHIEKVLNFSFPVLETLLEGVFIVSWTVRNDRSDAAYSVFLPDLEAFVEFLAVDCDVVINGEKDLRLAFLGDFVSPVHGVIGCSVEIHWSNPGIFFFIDTKFLHRLLIIPYDVNFSHDRTVHGRVLVQILHELRVVSCSSMRNRDQSKSNSFQVYVVGTSSVFWARQMELIRRSIMGKQLLIESKVIIQVNIKILKKRGDFDWSIEEIV